MATLVFILLILTNLILSGSGRAALRIRLLAGQGAVVSLLPLFIHAPGFGFRSVILAVLTAGLKIYLLPKLLYKAERQQSAIQEHHAEWNLSSSILFGVITIGIAMWIGTFLIKLPGMERPLFTSAVLSTLFIGLTLLIAGRRLLSQLIGYLIFGNGVFVIGVVLAQHDPLFIELGVVAEALVIAILLY